MNKRIKDLRENSLSVQPFLSAERARLITEFYETGIPEKVSAPLARAQAFLYILQHKKIYFGILF